MSDMTPTEIVNYLNVDIKNGSVKVPLATARIMLATAGALAADPANRKYYVGAMHDAISKGVPQNPQAAATTAKLKTANLETDKGNAVQIGADAAAQKSGVALTAKQQADVDALKVAALSAAAVKGG